MAAPIKAILIAIIASAALFVLTHLALFFPFYMTIIVETFNLANVAANDNYVKQMHYDAAFERLTQDRHLFSKTWQWDSGSGPDAGWANGNVRIRVLNSDNERAVGSNNEFDYIDPAFIGTKPYRQRGELITVYVGAAYPIEISMWNWTFRHTIDVSFSMDTIGLRYYKDLDLLTYEGY